ncbi:MAG TPA: hypothetical protein VKV74_11555 [Bryobacteraceae bacterium]|nr:hypothetical protein [Bryobacteraceae bacterium]
MSHRVVAFLFLAAFLEAVVLAPAPLAAQTANAVKTWTPPKTADGVPDLQGVYSNATTVPFERPKNLGSKEFYTEQEMAEKIKADAAAEAARANREADPNTVHYDLNQFGLNQRVTAVTNRTSQVIGPEGAIPPLLPEAQARIAAKNAAMRGHNFDDAQHRSLSERCILWPNEGPPMLSPGYNSDLQIVQGQGYVAIMQEMIHDTRVIPTDGSAHLPDHIRLLMGDSRGHWEGNTLVIDTTNFTDRTAFRNSSENLHVIERLTRTSDKTLLYQFTVEDPKTWAKPWSAEVTWQKIDSPIYEYACQEGNYGLPNILSGQRAAEKEQANAGK